MKTDSMQSKLYAAAKVATAVLAVGALASGKGAQAVGLNCTAGSKDASNACESYERSTTCLDKTIATTPYGGGILDCVTLRAKKSAFRKACPSSSTFCEEPPSQSANRALKNIAGMAVAAACVSAVAIGLSI
jgi:hypothetical protein